MAFTQDTFASVGAKSSKAPSVYSYRTDDTITTITASGYFSDKKNQLLEGDTIITTASDANNILTVTASLDTANPVVIPDSPNNTIVINDNSDFAIQDATTITLEANRKYVIGTSLILHKRFIVESNVIIEGTVDLILFYDEPVGSMFTIVSGGTFQIIRLRLRCPTAVQTFDVSTASPSSGFFFLKEVTVSDTPKFGTFNNTGFVLLDQVVADSIEDGLSLNGTIDQMVVDTYTIITSESSLIGIDFGTATIALTLTINDMALLGPSGAVGLSGLTNSGNISSFLIAAITNCRFPPPVTALVGITESDIRWEFRNCPPVPDSAKTADTFLTMVRTVPIAMANVYVAINGTDWTSDIEERFTTTTTGVLTYISPIEIKVLILATASVSKSGGGSDEIGMKIAINGTVVDKTLSSTQNANPTSLSSQGLFTLVTNDTIQTFVANLDTTTDVDVFSSSLTVINGF